MGLLKTGEIPHKLNYRKSIFILFDIKFCWINNLEWFKIVKTGHAYNFHVLNNGIRQMRWKKIGHILKKCEQLNSSLTTDKF